MYKNNVANVYGKCTTFMKKVGMCFKKEKGNKLQIKL